MNAVPLEALANEMVRDRLRQAARAALADQLPPAPSLQPAFAARQHLASALRGLAYRLDPSACAEPSLAVAQSR